MRGVWSYTQWPQPARPLTRARQNDGFAAVRALPLPQGERLQGAIAYRRRKASSAAP